MSDKVNQIHSGNGDNIAGNKYIYLNNSHDSFVNISLDSFLETLKGEFSFLPMMGVTRELDIENIFISLTLSPKNIFGEKMVLDTKGLTIDAPINEMFTYRDLGTPYRFSINESVSLHSILSHQKTIILGQPGSGKTTLLKHLLIDICKGLVCTGCIPIFIKLADIKVFEPGCINMFLSNKYHSYFHLINTAILEGKAVLFLDGFDEISPKQQDIIADEVSLLSSNRNKVCISCRTAVFPSNVLSSDFCIFECVGFSLSQRKKFINNWFPEEPAFATKVCKEILENTSTLGLSRNPLLLSLMVLQFEENPNFSLPQKRIDIYLGAINTLINKRELMFGNKIPHNLEFDLLKHIAFYMTKNSNETIPFIDLTSVINKWIKKHSFPSEEITASKNEIIDWLEKSGIMFTTTSQYNTSSQYQFLHLTFQEALTACYIMHYKDPVEYIKKYFAVPKWEETVRLIINQLDEVQTFQVCKYLSGYSEKLERKDSFLIVVGRYISDFSKFDNTFIVNTFNYLIKLFLNPPREINFHDLVAALSCICSAQHNNMRHFIETLKDNIANMHTLSAYIDILKISPSDVSNNELKRLFDIFSKKDNIVTNRRTEIIGMIISALKFTYDELFWRELYDMYIDNNIYQLHSHLSAITALSLSQIQSVSIKDLILKKLSQNRISLLDVSIIYKYEDPNINRMLYNYVFNSNTDYDLCCYLAMINDMELNLSDFEIKLLLNQLQNSHKKAAYLLCSKTLFCGKTVLEIVKNIIQNTDLPMVLRCSALDNYLRMYKNDPIELSWVASFIEMANITDFYIVAVNSLSYISNLKCIKTIINIFTKTNIPYQATNSLIHYLSSHTIEGETTINWLSMQMEKIPVDSEMYILCILALARHFDPFIYNKIDAYYHTNNGKKQILAVCKALAYLNTEEAVDALLKILDEQTDISIISAIISMLGNLSSSKALQKLFLYLDANNWPTNWPIPLPSLKQGEQRPTDTRKLNIIIALNHKRYINCLPLLHSIANDYSEATAVRHAAQIAINNLCWDKKTF